MMHSQSCSKSCFGLYVFLICFLVPFGNFVWEKNNFRQFSSGSSVRHSVRSWSLHCSKATVGKLITCNVLHQIQQGFNRTDTNKFFSQFAGVVPGLRCILIPQNVPGFGSGLVCISTWCVQCECKQIPATVCSKFP